MLMWRFLWCLLLVIPQVSVAATAQKPLKLPFLDWGACPFECCTYRDWVASENMTAYSSRDENSTAVFKIKQNETVKAITGVVVTRQAGLVDILKTVKELQCYITPVKDKRCFGTKAKPIPMKLYCSERTHSKN
jgi:hypothetical protein